MTLGRVRRLLGAASVRFGSRARSAAWRLRQDFDRLPLVLCGHGVYDGRAPGPGFPLRNFVTIDQLESEICWLRSRGYRFIPFETLADYLRGRGEVPRRSVHVMFDDGYAGVGQHAFPLLRENGVPFSVALVESFVRGGRLLWYDELYLRLQANANRLPEVNRMAPDLIQVAPVDLGRQIVYSCNRLKSVSDGDRRRFLDRVAKLFPLDESQVSQEVRPLSVRQLSEMASAGVAFLAHSRSHPVLSTLTDVGSLRYEVQNWAPELLRPGFFVLPYGTPSEMGQVINRALRDEGVEFAFSMVNGYVDRRSPPLALNRLSLQHDLKDVRARLARVAGSHMQSLTTAGSRGL